MDPGERLPEASKTHMLVAGAGMPVLYTLLSLEARYTLYFVVLGYKEVSILLGLVKERGIGATHISPPTPTLFLQISWIYDLAFILLTPPTPST
jgi:hypothetical protein